MSPELPTKLIATLTIVLFAGLLLPLPESNWQAEAAGNAESPRFGVKGQAVWDELQSPGHAAAEPTIGINWNTGNIFMQGHEITYRIDVEEGADPGLDPATATWTDMENEVSIVNVDPMLHTDPVTGRMWAGGLNGQGSVMGLSDDDGESWLLVYPHNGGSQFDHQSIGSGPWAVPAPLAATGDGEDRATYYCAQIPNMKCGVSYDGGVSWVPTAEIPGGCGGLHGHIRVTENGPMQGNVYVPNKRCSQRTGFAVSEDNGGSWEIRTNPQSKGDGYFDPSIGLSQDSGWLYFGQSERRGAWIGMSKDGGKTWEDVGQEHGAPDGTKWFNVGELAGIKRAMFADVQAGDDLRAAFAFLGSESDAPPDTCGGASAEHVWYYYIAITYDGGKRWNVQKMLEDPVQMGGIWPNGGGDPCRNLLDFNDMDIDRKGRLYVGYADGCIDCTNDQSSRSRTGTLLRQRTGCGLFQEFDIDPSNPFCISNSLPQLLDVGDKTIPVGETLFFELEATDPDDDEVRFKYSNDNFPAAADLTLGEKSGAFIWNTVLGEQGTYQVTLHAYEHLDPTSQDMETINIHVLPPNPPVAVPDAFEVYEDEQFSLDILGNDHDADEDPILLTSFDLTTAQGVALQRDTKGTQDTSDDEILYTSPENYNGPDSFEYTIFDGKWDSATGTVTIDVLPRNDPPNAVDDQFAMAPNSGEAILYVMDNDDTAPDTNEAIFVSAVDDAIGTVAVASNNAWLTYTPTPNFIGVDIFNYTLTDSAGASSEAEVRVRVTDRNLNIQADFEFEPVDSPIIGEEVDVAFTDLSSDMVEVIAWHWTFGDGSESIAQHPTHAYDAEGDYQVRLTVWGNGGEDSVTKTVTVVDTPPLIDFDWLTQHPAAGVTMGFVDQSSDADGTITQYYWDFNGDGNPDRTGPNVNWMWEEGGYHEVTLTIMDDAGNQVSLTKSLVLGGYTNKEGHEHAGGPSGGGAGYQPPWFEDYNAPQGSEIPPAATDAPEPTGNDTEEASGPVTVQPYAPIAQDTQSSDDASSWPAWATGLLVGLIVLIVGLLVLLAVLRRV